MTKAEKILKELDDILESRTIFPKSYTCVPSKRLKKSKGFDRTEEGGERNEYGNGWNDATMKLGNQIAEILDRWEKK